MREWLLQDEKAKVGRPKLATENLINKSKKLLVIAFLSCFLLSFCFISEINGKDPIKYAYSLTFSKFFGQIENPNGYKVKTYYNKDNNYIMDINVPANIKKMEGKLIYTTYYLKNNEWVEFEQKEIKSDKYRIIFKSKKNKNTTWKIKLQLIDSLKYKETYEPSTWSFYKSDKKNESYAYKVFTVKGYYSPVSLLELKESKKKDIFILTPKSNPRKFIINIDKYKYDINVSYIDSTNTKVKLESKKDLNKSTSYEIPEMEKATDVTFKICINELSKEKLEKLVPSTWKIEKSCAKASYILKPKAAY